MIIDKIIATDMVHKFGSHATDELEAARVIATAAIEIYGDFEEPIWSQFLMQGIWNDHAAVQAALAAIRLCRAGDLDGFPKQREVARLEDMSQRGYLRLILEDDGDIVICTSGMRADRVLPGSAVEFCTVGTGGGKSPKVRAALLALMCAIEQDNAEHPHRAAGPQGRPL